MKHANHNPDSSASRSSIAVVICTKDRPDALVRTLDSVWTQSHLPNELIVIDDGVLPEQIVSEISLACDALHIRWIYHRKSPPGLTRSRNVAAQLAASEILIYLDDDVTCAVNLLDEITDLMRDPQIAAISPVIREPEFEGMSAKMYQMGYRLACWWRVHPREVLSGSPTILKNTRRARALRWLSGASMALRRDIVLRERFDETLSEYALGEDREMGYRLAARHHLVEACATQVIHRREATGRTNHRRLGFMTSYNYLYILRKTCSLRFVDWLLIAWGLFVVASMHLVWGLRRPYHFRELLGMFDGLRTFMGSSVSAPGLPDLSSNRKSKISERTADPSAPGPNPKSKIPLRVLFVTTSLDPGGAELMLVALVQQLRAHQIEPIILSLKAAGPLAASCRETGIKVHEQFLRHKSDVAVIARIRDLIARDAIDIVCVAHSGGDRMFWATLAARTLQVPVVVWSHWFPGFGKRHLERPNRLLIRWVDAFVALGARHREALARCEHVPASRIHVIPNALDLDRFAAPERKQARRLLRLRDDQIGVGIVANFRPEKRHDVFIEAARRLHQRRPELRFFVIGDGPDRDAVLTAAAASGLNHDILRIIGARSDIPALLPGLDICCLCSEIECFSVTMLESAAAGCAFIAPNVGCLPEFIADGLNGLLIHPAHVGDLVDAIERLAMDSSLRHSITQAARRRVFEDYSLPTMADRFSRLFFDVSQNHQSRRYSRPLRSKKTPVIVRKVIKTA
jgi:glycosyltransferase involved in cell wall biosynthesis